MEGEKMDFEGVRVPSHGTVRDRLIAVGRTPKSNRHSPKPYVTLDGSITCKPNYESPFKEQADAVDGGLKFSNLGDFMEQSNSDLTNCPKNSDYENGMGKSVRFLRGGKPELILYDRDDSASCTMSSSNAIPETMVRTSMKRKKPLKSALKKSSSNWECYRAYMYEETSTTDDSAEEEESEGGGEEERPPGVTSTDNSTLENITNSKFNNVQVERNPAFLYPIPSDITDRSHSCLDDVLPFNQRRHDDRGVNAFRQSRTCGSDTSWRSASSMRSLSDSDFDNRSNNRKLGSVKKFKGAKHNIGLNIPDNRPIEHQIASLAESLAMIPNISTPSDRLKKTGSQMSASILERRASYSWPYALFTSGEHSSNTDTAVKDTHYRDRFRSTPATGNAIRSLLKLEKHRRNDVNNNLRPLMPAQNSIPSSELLLDRVLF